MRHHSLGVRPRSRQHWIVRYEGDATPLSEHPTLAEARRAAINHARQFGGRRIHILELDGDQRYQELAPISLRRSPPM